MSLDREACVQALLTAANKRGGGLKNLFDVARKYGFELRCTVTRAEQPEKAGLYIGGSKVFSDGGNAFTEANREDQS